MRAFLLAVLGLAMIGSAQADDIRVASWRFQGDGQSVSADLLVADVIAFQGAANPQAVRKVFKAGDFHMVFSRQLLQRLRDDKAAGSSGFGYTGMLVRRRSGLKVVQVMQLQEAAIAADGAAAKQVGPATLAVRLATEGKSFWVLSAEAVVGCGQQSAAEAESCAQLARQAELVRRFTDERQLVQQPVVVAATLHYALAGRGKLDDDPIWQILDQGVDIGAVGGQPAAAAKPAAGQSATVVAPVVEPQAAVAAADAAKPAATAAAALEFGVGQRFARIPGKFGTSACDLAAKAAGTYLLVDMKVIGEGGPADFGFVEAGPQSQGLTCAIYADLTF